MSAFFLLGLNILGVSPPLRYTPRCGRAIRCNLFPFAAFDQRRDQVHG